MGEGWEREGRGRGEGWEREGRGRGEAEGEGGEVVHTFEAGHHTKKFSNISHSFEILITFITPTNR